MPAPADRVFAWHCRPGAFERLTPPWENVKVLEQTGTIENGGRVILMVRAGGFWRRWVAQHGDYQQGRQFCDVQVEGPFRSWRHCHRVVPDGDLCILEDDIEYALPMGSLGDFVGGALLRHKLERMFRYRHEITARDLALHQKYSEGSTMRIAITGSTGLVGSALVPFLTSGGHEVVPIVRNRTSGEDVSWTPEAGLIDAERLEGLDAVVHLAGENIAARRWNAAQKARIRDSRIQGTKVLCEALARLRRPPRVLVSASAIGFYGNRGDEELTEASASGTGFLPEVCREWEAATVAAEKAGIRVVHLRFGIILSPKGGALAQMLTPFRLGVGGRLGNGRQAMSWIALDDVVGTIYHGLATETLRGPVNTVAPKPVTNLEFTKTLGRVLGRPTMFPVPGFLARLAFGEMANDLLLASTRVVPEALLDSGYEFLYPDLEHALRHLLGRYGTMTPDDSANLPHLRREAGTST
ncbi:MAG TPA: TIGR01777 family oxidoreductase [Gemmataceae bacterium]|nr:TIGR01777 family oxidoreductase [Gemmataceae bacterium]